MASVVYWVSQGVVHVGSVRRFPRPQSPDSPRTISTFVRISATSRPRSKGYPRSKERVVQCR
jgi:hypothetical protein